MWVMFSRSEEFPEKMLSFDKFGDNDKLHSLLGEVRLLTSKVRIVNYISLRYSRGKFLLRNPNF